MTWKKPMVLQQEEQREKMSIEDFFALLEHDPDHQYELIDGSPYMMAREALDHSIIGTNLVGIFWEQLRKRPCITYNSDVYIELEGEENCLCPDASISCDRRDHRATKVIHYPCLVAEVISPGTKARDRGIKADLYQGIPSVQEILFVDTTVKRVQLYQREADYWIMRNFTHDGDTIELARLNINFSVAEVYEKTTFDDLFAQKYNADGE